MDQAQLLSFLLDVVERNGLQYAIAGSHASMAYGEARLTNDIDVVVGLTAATLPAFCAAFPDDDFYVNLDGARTAAAKGGMFNIIHPESGLKIDVIVPADDFEREQLNRALRLPAFVGREARFVAPEDVIVKKLEYYNEGGSEKHLRDISGMIKVLGDRLDRDRIADAAARFQLSEIWERLLRAADNLRE